MSKTLRSAVLASLALGAASFAHADELGIGITITGEITPGVYGRVDISNRPAPPPLVYAQPVIIEPPPPEERVEPIYLHVPPGHARHWRKHCHEYHACGRPVYFVRSAEYDPDYVPREHGHHHDDDDEGHGHGHGHKHHDDD